MRLTTTFMCRMPWKSGSLILLEVSGLHRACYGTPLPCFTSGYICVLCFCFCVCTCVSARTCMFMYVNVNVFVCVCVLCASTYSCTCISVCVFLPSPLNIPSPTPHSTPFFLHTCDKQKRYLWLIRGVR